MPLGVKPVCIRCKNTQSSIWRKCGEGEVLCNSCHLKKNGNGSDSKNDSDNSKSNKVPSVAQYNGPVRKSARLKPSKYKNQYNPKPLATKGKNRRVIFKKNPIKAPAPVSTVVTQNHIFHDDQYWQVGDIVSVMDHGGAIYYAQIRGFLQDQYCQYSAVITWLLPTLASPKDRFEPSTYILGPEEELPRVMDTFEFVCHAPSEYYKAKCEPYTTLPSKPELAYIWTSIGPEIRPVPTREEIFGLKDGSEKVPVGKGGGRGRGRGGRRASNKADKSPAKEIKTEIKTEVA